MASILSTTPPGLPPLSRHNAPLTQTRTHQFQTITLAHNSLRSRTRSNSSSSSNGGASGCLGEGCRTKRREALIQILISGISFPFIATEALAEADLEESFRKYEDETNKFKILVPEDWLVGTGESDGIRSVTAFYPKEPSEANVSVSITGIGVDFTRLESFGSVDAFAEGLVSGLDRSWKNPPGLAAKLINSKAANGLYYLEYTLQNPGESRRHILSVVGMASNGWYNRLYTVTGQFIEDGSEKYRSQIGKSVSSFKFT